RPSHPIAEGRGGRPARRSAGRRTGCGGTSRGWGSAVGPAARAPHAPQAPSHRIAGRTTGRITGQLTGPPSRSLGGDLLADQDQVRVADVFLVQLVQLLPAALDVLLGRDLGQRVALADRVVAVRVGLGHPGAHRGGLRGGLSRLGLLLLLLLGATTLGVGALVALAAATGVVPAGLRRARGPCAGTLRGKDLLGDADLLGPRRLVRHALATVGLPGARRELQTAVVAVAGVDRPVPAALALREHVPVRVVPGSVGRSGGDRQRGAHGHAGGGNAGDVAANGGRLSVLASIRHGDVLVPPRHRTVQGSSCARPCPGVPSDRGMGCGVPPERAWRAEPRAVAGSGPTEHRRYVIAFDNGNETMRDLPHSNASFSPAIATFSQVRGLLSTRVQAEINYP